MKIRNFQITIQPCRYPAMGDEWRDLTVEVTADGRVMTTSHTLRVSSFEDEFGGMMRAAERLIRHSVKHAEVLREADDSIRRAGLENIT